LHPTPLRTGNCKAKVFQGTLDFAKATYW